MLFCFMLAKKILCASGGPITLHSYKWGVQHTLMGVPHAGLKLTPRVYSKCVYICTY